MNRLANEKSPYLLQHKNNPVDWYPWGSEAFEKAKQEDKPVLLSIGYSTCHWCHVMAHESFEDMEVADILNEDFVCIKVDREERPDIDAVYMRACQAMTGSGGWPTTLFLTPEQKPFFAGTYFPKHSRYGHFGFVELLKRISQLWKNNREGLLASGEKIAEAISLQNERRGEPRDSLIEKARNTLLQNYDPKWGGFGSAPKFPTPHNLLLLMQLGEMEPVEATLKAMARGGIFDQIGGGFSRYSTDIKWLKPHFEKMLYDNTLLTIAYCEAYERTKNEDYYLIAKRTADYMLRELHAPSCACYCGQDADSEGVEGKFYTFIPEEIISVLGKNEGEEFCRVYGINERNNIPNLISSSEEPWPEERLKKIFDYRRQRTALHTDDKVLLSWNAWAMIAFTKCGYTKTAIDISNFIEENMADRDKRLYLRYRDGEAANDGQLDDYAVYALALLNLYRATFDISYFEKAIFRAEQLLDFFEDESGGFYLTAHDAEELINRPKESYDGAIPSGNSVAAMGLEMLAQLTGEQKWRKAADRQMRFMAGQAEDYPAGHTFALLAMHKALNPERELIVCSEALPTELKNLSSDNFSILYKSTENAARLAKCAPFTADYPVPSQNASWYLCENGVCHRAVTSISELKL